MADNTDKPKSQTAKDIPWCKSLNSLPVFKREQIDKHRNNSGKRKADDFLKPIKNTLKRVLKFQEKRYLSSHTGSVHESIWQLVYGKSMSTREIHELEVSLNVTSANVHVLKAQCTCRAGNR